MSIFVKILVECIILLYGTYVFAGDLALNLGDHLFNSGEYEEAITEYKRFVFFNPTSELVSHAHYKIGMVYRNEKRWAESLRALRQSIETARTESIRGDRELAVSTILIASGNYSAAEFQLLRIESFSPDQILRRKAAFFRGIACLYSSKWKEAREALQAYFSGSMNEFPEDVVMRVNSALMETENLRYKSSSLAKWLSTFLPGCGQIYADDWRSGLNALAVNSAIAYLVFGSFAKGDYKDALLGLLVFSRYYFGNRFHAAQIAEKHNQRLNEIWTRRILRILMNDGQ